MTRKARLRGVALVLTLILPALGLPSLAGAAGFAPLEIRTSPIENFQIGRDATRFGEFEFRGGLVLASPNPVFGGLSGIDFAQDGEHFTAISDMGWWFRGRVDRANGWLKGVSDAEWAPMLNANGKPLGSKGNADAESLRLGVSKGHEVAYVSFERTNDLKIYRLEPDLARSKPQNVRLPASARGIRRNRGFEALAIAPAESPLAGAPILITERSLDKAGNNRAFVVNGPLAGAFSVVRSDDFDVTDADFLPNGDLLILERRVVMPLGVQMRLRRLDAARIRPGALVDGPVVMEANMGYRIDNMEGLAVTTDPNGQTRITLVSDDNFSFIQRTLVLEFLWLGPEKSAAAQ